jgi:hypothetical protein
MASKDLSNNVTPPPPRDIPAGVNNSQKIAFSPLDLIILSPIAKYLAQKNLDVVIGYCVGFCLSNKYPSLEQFKEIAKMPEFRSVLNAANKVPIGNESLFVQGFIEGGNYRKRNEFRFSASTTQSAAINILSKAGISQSRLENLFFAADNSCANKNSSQEKLVAAGSNNPAQKSRHKV